MGPAYSRSIHPHSVAVTAETRDLRVRRPAVPGGDHGNCCARTLMQDDES